MTLKKTITIAAVSNRHTGARPRLVAAVTRSSSTPQSRRNSGSLPPPICPPE